MNMNYYGQVSSFVFLPYVIPFHICIQQASKTGDGESLGTRLQLPVHKLRECSFPELIRKGSNDCGCMNYYMHLFRKSTPFCTSSIEE